MAAIEEVSVLADSMRQASALLADEDTGETSNSRRPSTFFNVVSLGNIVLKLFNLNLEDEMKLKVVNAVYIHIRCFVFFRCFKTFIAAPPLKLVDLPGLDQRTMDGSRVRGIVPAAQAPEIASS
ncbi:dynamin-2B [Trifolium pratense]|uniref:Dynamin-2B n=1 Tax=Trifolium pratense TaxID=57577 RepID=A0A2K3NI54_TRIPR|nr:dynamin-2B [Trifolium pratense]